MQACHDMYLLSIGEKETGKLVAQEPRTSHLVKKVTPDRFEDPKAKKKRALKKMTHFVAHRSGKRKVESPLVKLGQNALLQVEDIRGNAQRQKSRPRGDRITANIKEPPINSGQIEEALTELPHLPFALRLFQNGLLNATPSPKEFKEKKSSEKT